MNERTLRTLLVLGASLSLAVFSVLCHEHAPPWQALLAGSVAAIFEGCHGLPRSPREAPTLRSRLVSDLLRGLAAMATFPRHH
jgi:hypothetical protein